MFLFLVAGSALSALEIRIDYSYDTNNFFDTQQKRDAMEAVADFYGDMINDTLLRIDADDFSSASWQAVFSDPASGSLAEIENLIVPEDVIIIYVGARELGGSTVGLAGPGGFGASGFSDWFERLRGRGTAGAAESDPDDRTDFALWGGSIAFDTPRNWNFSLSENASGTEFISVALHEMGHVLGIGTAATWDNQLSSGTFTGSAALFSYGSAPPADGGHFVNGLNSLHFGVFDVTHGSVGPVMMLPSFTDTGSNFDVATDLDLAALVDIGWELTPPESFSVVALSPAAAFFTWNSVSFKNYEIQRSGDLLSFPDSSGITSGDGSIQSWSDPAPPALKAFYRLSISEPIALAAFSNEARLQVEPVPGSDIFRTIYQAPKTVEDCLE